MQILPDAEAWAVDGDPTAPRVLLCHGFTGSPQSLRPLAEHLGDDGCTVRLPRLPGHGTTWQGMNRTGWQDWYARVERSLLQLTADGRPAVVGGLSMGGALALALAEAYPARVCGLALINPAVRLDRVELPAVRLLRHLVPSLAGVGGDIALEGAVEVAYDRTPLHALASQLDLWKDVVEGLPTVRQPLLLLRSRVDNIVPASSSALVLDRVGSSDVTEIVLERSRHVATLDHDAPRIHDEVLSFAHRTTPGRPS